jgi:ribosomal protein S18 acetylase RimI-like enzyme
MIDLTALNQRPLVPSDRALLFELYASTRAKELTAWHWSVAQQTTFLEMQFAAQQQAYQAAFPDREQQLVRLDDVPIGIIQIARQPTVIHLVDLALLPDYRNQGIGTALLQQLCATAARHQRSVQLHVLCSNRAMQLYQRLGFVAIGEPDVYCWMEWGAAQLVATD